MESKLKKKIRDYLQKKSWWVIKVNLCSVAGFPDLICLSGGHGLTSRIVFIETKSEGKEARPLQKYVHDKLRSYGFDVHVIDTWEKFQTLGL